MQWRKPDADKIAAFMAGLPTALGLGKQRRWWPQCLFRSDHVENAAQILNDGRLLSRAQAERSGAIIHDSGSQEHIGELTDQQRDCVRLYFRPLTPTQYANEGIRPVHAIKFDAHMPVPVYLLFSTQLLEYEGVGFSKGRLALGTETGGSHEFLSSIDFREVYHNGPVSTASRHILNARHAEAFVTSSLGLDHLMRVVCRSGAERDTLLYLMTHEARRRWQDRIVVDQGRVRLFFKRRGTFLRDVALDQDKLTLRFYGNIRRDYRGPFSLRIVVRSSSRRLIADREEYFVDDAPAVFELGTVLARYDTRVTMNGDLAYAGECRGRQVRDAVVP